jgi:hypothetical protein
MGKVVETTEQTTPRVCNSAKCKGKSTSQRLIKRTEEGEPVRKIWECAECRAREFALPGRTQDTCGDS